MTPQELQEYFEQNPPPEEVQWKEWAKITDTKKFITNSLISIRQSSNYNKCPDYWHLLEFYQDIRDGKI